MAIITDIPIYQHQIKSTPIYIAKLLDDVYCFIIEVDDLNWNVYQCYAPNGHAEPVEDMPIMTTATLDDAIDYLNVQFSENQVVQNFIEKYNDMKNKRCSPRQIEVMSGISNETQEDATRFFAQRVCYFAMKDMISKIQFNKIKVKK